jgi:hypothetical protein
VFLVSLDWLLIPLRVKAKVLRGTYLIWPH